MRRYLGAFLLASLSVLVACGGGEESPAPESPAPARSAAPPAKTDETVAFKLGEENRSGVSGTVRLKGGDRGFAVKVAVVRPRYGGPAHIHSVTCEKYRALKDFDAQLGTVAVPLTDLEDGKSRTRVETALSQYRTAGYSINVHSYDGGFPVVACGDVPAG